MKHTTLLIILLATQLTLSLYSPYYKRCRLNKNYTDNDAIPIENLSIERLPKYYSSFYIEPVADPEQ